jgi:DNA-binding transcriptional MerR regulator
MQKMQQLDLFGMPVEPVSAPVKKTTASKTKPVQEQMPEPEPVVVAEVVAEPEPIIIPEPVAIVTETLAVVVPEVPVAETTIPEAPATPTTDPIVFADERIVVKIKPKNTVTETKVAEATAPAPLKAATEPAAKQPGKRGRKSFREIDTEIDLVDIPDEETLKQKLYYPISEVAKWFKVNTSLLRYWENEFDILQPRKTLKGDRLFRYEDIRNLQLIYFLLRQRKFSIEGARTYLKQNKHQADVQAQLVQSLTKFKSFLLELRAGLGN